MYTVVSEIEYRYRVTCRLLLAPARKTEIVIAIRKCFDFMFLILQKHITVYILIKSREAYF